MRNAIKKNKYKNWCVAEVLIEIYYCQDYFTSGFRARQVLKFFSP